MENAQPKDSLLLMKKIERRPTTTAQRNFTSRPTFSPFFNFTQTKKKPNLQKGPIRGYDQKAGSFFFFKPKKFYFFSLSPSSSSSSSVY